MPRTVPATTDNEEAPVAGWTRVSLEEFVHSGLLYYVNSKLLWSYGLALTIVKPGKRDEAGGWDRAQLVVTQTDPPRAVRSGRDDDMLDTAMEWLNARSVTLGQ